MRVVLCVLGLAALPAPAFAFSDPAQFALPVTVGGGGGRYFTGSRADGYGCSVCHQGGATPAVTIEGMPDRLVTGTRYELTVRWDRPEIGLGLQLELTTATGAHPDVNILPPDQLPPESRCEQRADGLAAVYAVDVGVRRIIGVEDCAASAVTLSFVATGDPIDLAISAVRSDQSGTANGDGVFEERVPVGRYYAVAGGGGCDASGPAPNGFVAALLALLLIRSRARRVQSLRAPTRDRARRTRDSQHG